MVYARGVVPRGAGGDMPWHPQILADRLTLSQLGGTDYVYLITTGTPGFSNLPTALNTKTCSFRRHFLAIFFSHRAHSHLFTVQEFVKV